MAKPQIEGLEETVALLSDWRWRLNNLYWITDQDGQEVKFKMNWAQKRLFENMHYLNVILKARQLGFSTFIVIFMLDAALFNKNVRCGLIDKTLDDAKSKITKITFAYERLPDWLKNTVKLETSNTLEVEFSNGSGIKAGTSLRGGTLQYLHISEYGKICAKHPDKSREIRTGALNTLQVEQICFIESTAEGQEGHFFDVCQDAQAKDRMDTHLTPLDFKFHFYPWHEEPSYVLDARAVVISDDEERYFADLKAKEGIDLTPEQKAWYVKKKSTQLDDMKREYPATPDEAFEASIEGAIFGREMQLVEEQGRIKPLAAIKGVPVHTFWDIGRRDYTSIWFAQILMGPEIRILGYYQNCMAGLPHYVEYLMGSQAAMKAFPQMSFSKINGIYEDNGWTPGQAVFPHDIKVTEWGSDRSRIEQAKSAGLDAKIGTELSLHDGINACRATIPYCDWDDAGTAEGRKILKLYRWDWDEHRGAWRTGTPRHDTNSHGADGYRTLATSWREIVPDVPKHNIEKAAVIVKDGNLVVNADVTSIIAQRMAIRKDKENW